MQNQTQEQIQQLNAQLIALILQGSYEFQPNRDGQTVNITLEGHTFKFYMNEFTGRVKFLPLNGPIGLGFTDAESKQLYDDFNTKKEYQEYLKMYQKFGPVKEPLPEESTEETVTNPVEEPAEGSVEETAPEQPVDDSSGTEDQNPPA